MQGKLPGSSPGGASAAAGSSGRANGVALPTAVKPEDEAKEQGNAALKQGDYDQVMPMLCLEMLLDVSCRRDSQGGALIRRLEMGRLVLCLLNAAAAKLKDEAEEQGNAALRWGIVAHLPYAAVDVQGLQPGRAVSLRLPSSAAELEVLQTVTRQG